MAGDIRNVDGGAHYVDEKPGNMPYLIFFQSTAGWPVFEPLPTWAQAFEVCEVFRAKGINVMLYHAIAFDDLEPAQSKRLTMPGAPPGTLTKDRPK